MREVNQGKEIIVTGASGFLGEEVVKRLSEKNRSVNALITANPERQLVELKDVKYYSVRKWPSKSIIETVKYIAKVYKGKEICLIHCAGDATYGNGNRYYEVNTKLTNELADCLFEINPKTNLLFAVVLQRRIYREEKENTWSKNGWNERTKPNPRTDYARASSSQNSSKKVRE